jgi:hypothetical protein
MDYNATILLKPRTYNISATIPLKQVEKRTHEQMITDTHSDLSEVPHAYSILYVNMIGKMNRGEPK